MNTLLSHEQLNQQDLALSNQGHSVLRPSFGLIVVGFFIAGMLYATASVSIAQLIFPKQANGSVIELNGKIIGSSLVGQNFVSEQYFHGRPSAVNYNVDGMAGSNLAISNPDLQTQIKFSIKFLYIFQLSNILLIIINSLYIHHLQLFLFLRQKHYFY